jgi:hypothetical protein
VKQPKKTMRNSSLGIAETHLMLDFYAKHSIIADVIETSGLNYSILRPTWFTNANEVDYEITQKGQSEMGSVISQKSLATFITKIIDAPERYIRSNLGINKPDAKELIMPKPKESFIF